MVSPYEAGFNLRESFLLSPDIPCIVVNGGNQSRAPQRIHKLWREATSSFTTEPNTHNFRGQRTSQLEGYRNWLRGSTSSKDGTGHLDYPVSVRDSAKSGLGCFGNRYLNYLAEVHLRERGRLLSGC
jgi:hypothetical protein